MPLQELISVIMPVYNAEKYVREAIQSILNQTYSNIEFIIIDDGSKDNSVLIIKEYKDSRIRLYEREHRGIVEQLNYGLEVANGNYIARMDSDDLCHETRIQKQFEYLSNNKNIQLVGTNHYYINQIGKIITEKKLPENHEDIIYMMPILNSIVHASILTTKGIYNQIGGYKKGEDYIEDHLFFLELIKKGYKLYNIQEPLYSYRLIDNSIIYMRQKEIREKSYWYGKEMIMQTYKPDSYDYNYSLGLLEYYKGDMKFARLYLKKAKKLSPDRILFWRYIIFTYMGNTLIHFLRRKKILWKLSSFINKSFLIDFHLIKKKVFI